MTPGTYDIETYEGATYAWSLEFLENNAPMDLSGAALRMEVRYAPGTAIKLALTNDLNGGLIVDGNEVSFSLEALTAGEWVYDIFIVQGSQVIPYVKGKITVEARVTLIPNE